MFARLLSLIKTREFLYLILVIAVAGIIVISNRVNADIKIWGSQAEWGSWSQNNTSNTVSSGNLTLNQGTGSWVSAIKPVSPDFTIRAMAGSSTSSMDDWGFAVGDGGHILKRVYSQWITMPSPTNNDLKAIFAINSSDVYAVGVVGTIVHYNGTTWTPQSSGVTTDLNGIGGKNSSNIYAVGSGGVILKYDGQTWSEDAKSKIVTTNNLNSVYFKSSFTAGWAVGDLGTVLNIDIQVGSNWAVDSTFGGKTTANLRSVIYGGVGNPYVVGDDGILLRKSAGVWNIDSPPAVIENLNDMSFDLSGNNIWVVGNNNTIRKCLISGGVCQWSIPSSTGLPSPSTNFYAIISYNLGERWVGGSSETLSRQIDSGKFPMLGLSSINFQSPVLSGLTSWNSITVNPSTQTSGSAVFYAKSSSLSSCPSNIDATSGWTLLTLNSGVAGLSSLSQSKYLCIAIVLSASSGGDATPTIDSTTIDYTPAPISFDISVSKPTDKHITTGQNSSNNSTEITIARLAGYSDPISLSLFQPPQGISGNFSSPEVVDSTHQKSVLTINIASGVIAQSYNLQIAADSGGKQIILGGADSILLEVTNYTYSITNQVVDNSCSIDNLVACTPVSNKVAKPGDTLKFKITVNQN